MMGGVRIEATSDAGVLASIHARTVAVAYAGYFPQDAGPPSVGELSGHWEEYLANRTAAALVAWSGHRALGAVAVRHDPDFIGEGQFSGLHVLPAEWGEGIGGALHDAALDLLARERLAQAGLWVIRDNLRARAMYEARSWALLPGVELDVVGVCEVRYRRTIPARTD